jgi:hypothetical protein
VSRTSGNSATAQMKDLVGPGNISIANCGAIKVTKTSTKGDAPLAGATFTVKDSSGAVVPGGNLTTGDDGTACVGSLPLANGYTVTETGAPTGYKINNPDPVTVNITAAGTCTSGAAEPAVFTDTPLSEIEVKFTSLAKDADGNDVTASSIVCDDDSTPPAIDAVEENGDDDPAFDDTDETFTDLEPGTYTCTVVVDP